MKTVLMQSVPLARANSLSKLRESARLREAGVHVLDIKELLGHKTMAMVERYSLCLPIIQSGQ
jgi:hypothetical protein